MENIKKIQEYLFENKESIPNKLYVNLINNLKPYFEYNNSNYNFNFNKYEIEYIVYAPEPNYHTDTNISIDTYFLQHRGVIKKHSMIINFDELDFPEYFKKQCENIPFSPFNTSGIKTLLKNTSMELEPDIIDIDETVIVCNCGILVLNCKRLF